MRRSFPREVSVILLQITASAVWSKVWTVAVALLFFGLIIMIHECGHFAVAKLCKVKVNEFALGMGPALIKKKKGDTLYAWRLFPIGGYCAMEGEDADSEDTNAFNKKPVWQKLLIVTAGAIMNLLLGLILMLILLSVSTDLIGTNTVHSFYPDAVSAQYGLREGDRFVEIEGHRVWSEKDLGFLMSRSEDGVLDFVVERDGALVELNDVHFATEEYEGVTLIRYDFSVTGVEPTFGTVLKNTFTQSASIVRMVYLSLFDLVTGRYGMSQMAGPVGTMDMIADVTAEAASSGSLESLLTIMAFITINVGVANLLPLPALDGGRLLFLLIEAVRRKPINPKYEGYVHAAGFVLLMLLMVAVTFNDILRIARGG